MEDFDQAKIYDSNSTVQREDGLNLMNLLCLEEGSKVLDLGCGTAWLPYQGAHQQSGTKWKGMQAQKQCIIVIK